MAYSFHPFWFLTSRWTSSFCWNVKYLCETQIISNEHIQRAVRVFWGSKQQRLKYDNKCHTFRNPRCHYVRIHREIESSRMSHETSSRLLLKGAIPSTSESTQSFPSQQRFRCKFLDLKLRIQHVLTDPVPSCSGFSGISSNDNGRRTRKIGGSLSIRSNFWIPSLYTVPCMLLLRSISVVPECSIFKIICHAFARDSFFNGFQNEFHCVCELQSLHSGFDNMWPDSDSISWHVISCDARDWICEWQNAYQQYIFLNDRFTLKDTLLILSEKGQQELPNLSSRQVIDCDSVCPWLSECVSWQRLRSRPPTPVVFVLPWFKDRRSCRILATNRSCSPISSWTSGSVIFGRVPWPEHGNRPVPSSEIMIPWNCVGNWSGHMSTRELHVISPGQDHSRVGVRDTAHPVLRTIPGQQILLNRFFLVECHGDPPIESAEMQICSLETVNQANRREASIHDHAPDC
jgi:hypothetical protein